MKTYTDAQLDTLWQERKLCEICEDNLATTTGRYHDIPLCDACAEDEPHPHHPLQGDTDGHD